MWNHRWLFHALVFLFGGCDPSEIYLGPEQSPPISMASKKMVRSYCWVSWKYVKHLNDSNNNNNNSNFTIAFESVIIFNFQALVTWKQFVKNKSFIISQCFHSYMWCDQAKWVRMWVRLILRYLKQSRGVTFAYYCFNFEPYKTTCSCIFGV